MLKRLAFFLLCLNNKQLRPVLLLFTRTHLHIFVVDFLAVISCLGSVAEMPEKICEFRIAKGKGFPLQA
jgi:hypothetical protein